MVFNMDYSNIDFDLILSTLEAYICCLKRECNGDCSPNTPSCSDCNYCYMIGSIHNLIDCFTDSFNIIKDLYLKYLGD